MQRDRVSGNHTGVTDGEVLCRGRLQEEEEEEGEEGSGEEGEGGSE